MRDIAYDLVENACRVKFSDLPADVVEVTKKFILDSIGCGIAGSTAPGTETSLKLLRGWGGKEESTVMVHGGKLPAPAAAFINSVMIGALEIDDIHEKAVLHAHVTSLPAALALAETVGGVNGKDLIAAVAVGVDMSCRIALGIFGGLRWAHTAVAGCFGATVAAGRILGLDRDRLHHALGIVYDQCAGNVQCVLERTMVRRSMPGFAAQASVVSAVMANHGVTGPREVFEGRCGFYPLYLGGNYDRVKVVNGLGKTFEGTNLGVKLYVGGYYTHPCIEACLGIVKKNNIQPADVEEIVAHVPEFASVMVGRPFEIATNPQIDAQFSIPYALALAVARRHVFVDDFSEEKIRGDRQVLELSGKVRVIGDQGSLEAVGRGMTPVIIEIRTRDGRLYSGRVDAIEGGPQRPVGMERIAEKFRTCCTFSARPPSKERTEGMIETFRNLEQLTDVTGLARMTVE